jgi:hypothetical protein
VRSPAGTARPATQPRQQEVRGRCETGNRIGLMCVVSDNTGGCWSREVEPPRTARSASGRFLICLLQKTGLLQEPGDRPARQGISDMRRYWLFVSRCRKIQLCYDRCFDGMKSGASTIDAAISVVPVKPHRVRTEADIRQVDRSLRVSCQVR